MSVTIHLYAAYPIVFYAVRRWGPLPVYFSGSALAVLTMLLYCRGPLRAIFPNFLSFGPIFVAYLVPWLLGVLLAEVAAKRACLPRNWHTIGLIGFIAGPLLQWSGMREAADVAFSLGMAALVQWSLENPSTGLWKSRLGKHLAWLGGISYSLYLTHVPTLAFIRALCWPEKSSNLSPFLVGSLASVLVGWAFYYFFERSASKRSCG
jgi:peptidoglycan/LPS O-acetylase OafA/YrhL